MNAEIEKKFSQKPRLRRTDSVVFYRGRLIRTRRPPLTRSTSWDSYERPKSEMGQVPQGHPNKP